MARRAVIFGGVVPGRPSLGLCGPLGRHPPSAAGTRPCLADEAVKRKVQAASRPTRSGC